MPQRLSARAHAPVTVYLRVFLILCLTAGSTFHPALAQAAPPEPAGQSYAILIGGIPGQEPYGRWYADWLARMKVYLTSTAQLQPDHIISLSDKDATMDALTAAFKKFAQAAKPQDQLIFFIVGHGEINAGEPTLSLAGPDPTASQIAALLNAFPGKNQIVLNFSASSGDFLKPLSSPGRVYIAATSPSEVEEPVYAEFFLRGLESKRADADKNGTVTLLEAYNWAAQQTPNWIARWQQTGDPKELSFTTWKASGKETVEIYEKLYAFAPTRRLDPASNRTAPDTVPELEPPGGQVTADWAGRRAVDEHALLEDSGQGIGVSVLSDKGVQPILGLKPGDPGYLAAHTVLGQSTLLTP